MNVQEMVCYFINILIDFRKVSLDCKTVNAVIVKYPWVVNGFNKVTFAEPF